MSTESETEPGRLPTGSAFAWVDGSLLGLCLGSLLVAILGGLVQVRYGSYPMSFAEAWSAVTDPAIVLSTVAWRAIVFGADVPVVGAEFPTVSNRTVIVWTIRMPRVFVAVIVGMALAISGAIFQAVTRNELASPYVLGVSSGAGFAVLLTLVVFSGLAPFIPLFAAVGGALAFVLVYTIAWKGGTSPVRLVLAGVIVNMVFQSLQRGLFFFAGDLGTVQTALAWITGSLTGVGWEHFRIALVPILVAVLLALAGARQLNVLLLGEQTASSLGMDVELVRFGLSGVAILAASAAIAVAGIIGFFGLVVPHVVRLIVGSDYRRLLVGCVFAGPALLVVADVGARLGLQVLMGTMGQVPVGIVTGLVGGPYFLYLMRKQDQMGEL